MDIPYTVFEDNIEGGNPFVKDAETAGGLEDTLIALIAERASLDMEEWCLLADTASADEFLAMTDGWLKLSNAHTVNAGAAISRTVFKNARKAMPDPYLRNPSALVHFVSTDQETEYRDLVAERPTGLGDATVTGLAPVYAFGSPVQPASMMPNAKSLYTDPKNLIIGVQRQIHMEYGKDIRARMFIIVLTLRIDCAVETTDATVLTTGIT